MGRIKRKREQKKEKFFKRQTSVNTVDSDNLKSWMLAQSEKFKCDLVPYIFPETGRGLMTLKDIKAGDDLLELPKQFLITTTTVSKSSISDIFLPDMIYDSQSVLAAFIVYERHLGDFSIWKPYVDSLPTAYSNPEFCLKSEKNALPDFIKNHSDFLLSKIKAGYLLMVKSMEIAKKSHFVCCHCNLTLDKILTFNAFLWGYYTVNTRAVYLNNNDNIDINVKDDNLALAPFLDLFNHVCENVATASLTKRGDSEFYLIKTQVSYKQRSQVFINYGAHSNLKLYTEYGFIISQNPLDKVTFEILDVQQFITLSDKVINYLHKQKMNSDMYFNCEGLSYNARNTLFVLSTISHPQEWNKKIYCEQLDSDDMSKIIFLAQQVLHRKKYELEQSLKKMKNVTCKSNSFLLAVNFVEELVKISENCLKSFDNLYIN